MSNMDPPTISGWLHKKKDQKAMLSGAYTKRWFVLRGAMLSYYESDDETSQAKGEIDITQCTTCQHMPGDAGSFLVHSEARLYKFKAEPLDQAASWVTAISAVLPTNSPARPQTTEIATSPMKLSPEKKAAAREASTEEAWVSKAEETEMLQNTHFTGSDLTRLKQKYQAMCGPESSITRARLYTTFRWDADAPNLGLDRLFALLDRDEDGQISPSEYVHAMELLTHGTMSHKAEFAFTLYDLQGNGRLDRKSMKEVTVSILEVIQSSYQSEQNQVINIDSSSSAELVESMVTQAFNTPDGPLGFLRLPDFQGLCKDHFAVLDDFIREHARAGLESRAAQDSFASVAASGEQ